MAISDAARTAIFLSPPIFLLFPSAALIHILDRIATRRFRNHFDSNIFDANFNIDLPRPDGKGTIEVTLLQKIGPGVAITAAYLAAYAVAVLSIAGIWQLKKVEGTARFERLWVWVVLILNFLMVAGSLGVFGYATSVQVGDATWKTYNDAGTPGQKHTRETWACEIDKFFPGQYWAGSVCGLSRGMRYLVIVMAAASVCVLAGLFVIIKSRGGMKWVFGGKGRYAGFQGVYEMQSQGPHAPYDGAPYAGPSTGQWGQQPIQPWPPVQLGHQQTGYQPVSQAAPQQIGEVPKSDANGEQRAVFR